MPSTALAAATGLPTDRRSLLSGAALASLVAATAAVPALAAEPVGPIERAYDVWLEAARAADVACEATWEAEERYEEPERPVWHPAVSAGDYNLVRLPEQKCRVCLSDSPENIAKLRAIIAKPFRHDQDAYDTPEFHRSRIERAQATLDKIEAWQGECRQRADACGLTAAQEHERPLMLAMRQIRDDLLTLTPASFREAAFQAAVLSIDWDESAVGRLVENLAALANIPAYHEEAESIAVGGANA